MAENLLLKMWIFLLQYQCLKSILAFAKKNLTLTDMVYLYIGAHTVGEAHCVFIQHRLYNFQNTGQPYPTLNATLARIIRSTCPPFPNSNTLDLDQNPMSSLTVDNSYYKQLLQHRGILQIHHQLALHPQTVDTCQNRSGR